MKTKSTLLSAFTALLLLTNSTVFSQILDDHNHIHDHVCVLPAGQTSQALPSTPYTRMTKEVAAPRTATFIVNYLANGTTHNGYNCSTWPAAAQTAFDFAANIWGNTIESNQTIYVDACWTADLGASTLGAAGASGFHTLTGGSAIPNTFYPKALTEAIADVNTNSTNGDINAYFNANRTDWYYGTDASPAFTEYDFVTVVLHELGHGLGFAGGNKIDDGSSANGTECDGTNGNGCVGLNASGTFYPTVYTRFVETDNGADINTVSNPSGDIADLLVGTSISGGSGGLFFNGSGVMTSNSGAEAQLYTPSSYTSGSTYSHFDLATFGSEIMKPSLPNGQAIHTPGMAADLLIDLGWVAAVLPVDLLHFEGYAQQSSIWLDWESTDEYNNDGFEIQRSLDGKSWQTIGFKKGTNQAEGLSHYLFEDKEPFQGKNYYRLRQRDFDGSAARSKVISVELAGKQSLLSVAPNPAVNNLQIQWQASGQFDKSAPYQVAGSTGKILLSGTIEEGQKNLDISSLPPGIYQLVIQTTQELLTHPFVKI